MLEKNESEWIHCNSCGRTTDHVVVHKHRNSEFKEDLTDDNGSTYASIDGFKDWWMLECQGCKTVCLRFFEYFSEWSQPGDDGSRIVYFPARNVGSRTKPSWFAQFIEQQEIQGHFILIAYQQVYDLLESKHCLAALLTCRALLETISIEHGNGDGKSFEEKLKALRAKEIISSSQITFLNRVIYDAGSAAMHRSYNPTEESVGFVLDVIEKILHTIYIEPFINKHLLDEIPKRPKR